MNQELLTREEVMPGLPARRASTLLFLIERRRGVPCLMSALVHLAAGTARGTEGGR